MAPDFSQHYPLLKRFGVLVGLVLLLYGAFDFVFMPIYTQQGSATTVPNVMGVPVEEALQILEAQGLTGKLFETRQDKDYPEGTVAAQTPPAGSEVKFGRGIYLTVSGGEPVVTVPGLRGRSVRDAILALERFGLMMGEIRYFVSSDFPENTIIGQTPVEGSRVASRTIVNVIASQGPRADRVPVPNVLRRSLADAERIIRQAGLEVGNITFQVSGDLLPNTVIEQFPRSGTFLSAGQTIELFVAQKPDARTILEN